MEGIVRLQEGTVASDPAPFVPDDTPPLTTIMSDLSPTTLPPLTTIMSDFSLRVSFR